MMDWDALRLSLLLAVLTVALLVPFAIWVGRRLAQTTLRSKPLIEALIALPLVLPPTVLGFYLLSAFGLSSPIGQIWQGIFGRPLAFSFEGLLIASILVNLPFAIQPIQRGFEAIPDELRDAAGCCGMSPMQRLWRVELPLAWPAVLTGAVLTFAHTLGEFGVVLMVGGAIPGETKTIAISIYDSVQGFDSASAAKMSALLLAVSISTITATFLLSRKIGRRLS